MNLTRLMVLGVLAQHGPRHGHEIRRMAEVTNVGEWGGVSVGALYRELRVMEAEHLVEPLRTEQVGRRPARTVYSITGEGQLELAMLREKAVRSMHWGPDPITSAQIEDERQRLLAKGYLEPLPAAVMYRAQLHAETEVRWHDEVAKILADLPAQSEDRHDDH